MKLFIFLFAVSICCTSVTLYQGSEKEVELIKLSLQNDSGYLLKNECFKILNQLDLTNKKIKGWNSIHQNDTVGKYYKSLETGNYILCIYEPQNDSYSDAHILVELKKKGETSFIVIAKERYVHGMNKCCWNNYTDGFTTMGDYFKFDYCVSGTENDFCGSNCYYFKTVNPQNKSMYITNDYKATSDGSIFQMTSLKELKSDTLTYYYKIESFEKIKDEFQLQRVDTLIINYYLKNNVFICNDERYENLEY
jgi:hypothetical protein